MRNEIRSGSMIGALKFVVQLVIILWLKIVDPTTKRMAQICDPSLQVATCIDIQEHPWSIYS